ncbi:metal ABC transporter ATP-binding protein [Marinomonas posidonica]|nr:ABC transporter ATP-binding protein [Marinomonas posidonica]
MGTYSLGSSTTMSDIKLNNVSVSYGQKYAVDSVSGSFAAGSLTAIAGPNGAGKSTLLKALMGELPLTMGEIHRGNLKIQDFSYLPQANEINRQFPLSVEDLVSLGIWRQKGAFGRITKDCLTRIREALVMVGLEDFGKHQIGTLSAGQFQRVLFARLLVQDAQVIILDEPFNAIDEGTINDLLKLIRQWHQQQRTVIAVLHDFEQIQQHFPNTLLLARQAVYWGDSKTALCAAHRQFAKNLTSSWNFNRSPIRNGTAA